MDDKKQINIESLLKKLEQFKPQENVVKKKEETLVNSADWYLAGEGKTVISNDAAAGNDKINSLEKTLGALARKKKELELQRRDLAKLEALTPEEDKAVRKDYVVDKKTNVSFGDYQIKKQKNFSKIIKWGAFGATAIVAVVLVLLWVLNMTPAIPDSIGFNTDLTQITIGDEELLYARESFGMKIVLPSSFSKDTINLTTSSVRVTLSKETVKPGEEFQVIIPNFENIGRVTITAQYKDTNKTQDIVVYVDRPVTSLEFANSSTKVENTTSPKQAESLVIQKLDSTQPSKTTFYVGQYATLFTKTTPELIPGTSNYRDIVYEIIPDSQKYDIRYNPDLKTTSDFRLTSNNIVGDGDDVIELSPDGVHIIAKRPGVARVIAKTKKWLAESNEYIYSSKEIEIRVAFPEASSYSWTTDLDLFMGQENTFKMSDVIKSITGKYEIHQYGQSDEYISSYYKDLTSLLTTFKGSGWFNVVPVSQSYETVSVKSQTNDSDTIILDAINDVSVASEVLPSPKQHTVNLYIGNKKLSSIKSSTGAEGGYQDSININLKYNIDFKADVSNIASALNANILAFNGKDYVQFEDINENLISFVSSTSNMPFLNAFDIKYEIYQFNSSNASLSIQDYLINNKVFAPKEEGIYYIKAYLQSKLSYDITGTYTNSYLDSEITIIPAGGKLIFSLSDNYFTINVKKLKSDDISIVNKSQVETNFVNKLNNGQGDFLTVTSLREFDSVTVANPAIGKTYISAANILTRDIVSFNSSDALAQELGADWKLIDVSSLETVNLGETYTNLPISDSILNTYFDNLIMSLDTDSSFVINTFASTNPNRLKIWNNKIGTTNLKINFRTAASSFDEFSIENINLTTYDNIVSVREDFRSLGANSETTFGGDASIALDFKLTPKNLTNYLNEALLSNYSLSVKCVGGTAQSKFASVNSNGTIEYFLESGEFIEGDTLKLEIEVKRKNIDRTTGLQSVITPITSLEVPIRGTVTFVFSSTGLENL